MLAYASTRNHSYILLMERILNTCLHTLAGNEAEMQLVIFHTKPLLVYPQPTLMLD